MKRSVILPMFGVAVGLLIAACTGADPTATPEPTAAVGPITGFAVNTERASRTLLELGVDAEGIQRTLDHLAGLSASGKYNSSMSNTKYKMIDIGLSDDQIIRVLEELQQPLSGTADDGSWKQSMVTILQGYGIDEATVQEILVDAETWVTKFQIRNKFMPIIAAELAKYGISGEGVISVVLASGYEEGLVEDRPRQTLREYGLSEVGAQRVIDVLEDLPESGEISRTTIRSTVDMMINYGLDGEERQRIFLEAGIDTTTLTIFDNEPGASLSANPNPASCNQSVTFDGSSSTHGRPDRSIVRFEWDFGDGQTYTETAASAPDGAFDGVTNHPYGAFGPFNATLTVTDDNVPPKTDTASVTVNVDQGNNPPIADPGGPYSANRGSALPLDGSGSSDPDTPCGDFIQSYEWDLDNDGVFADAAGVTPTVPAATLSGLGLGVGSHTIRLRVTDSLGATGTTSTTVTIADIEVSFAVATSSVGEGTASHLVTVRLSTTRGVTLASPVHVDVFLDIDSNTAAGGEDYSIFSTQTVTFPVGSSDGDIQQVTLDVLEDARLEGDETLVLRLANATGPATIGALSSHTVTIVDDDFAEISFEVAASTAPEGAGPHRLHIRLSTTRGVTLATPVSVDVIDLLRESATAASGQDYAAFGTQTVTFPVGSSDGDIQQVTLETLDDSLLEGDETLQLALANVTGPANIGAPSSHTVTIVDDETASGDGYATGGGGGAA